MIILRAGHDPSPTQRESYDHKCKSCWSTSWALRKKNEPSFAGGRVRASRLVTEYRAGQERKVEKPAGLCWDRVLRSPTPLVKEVTADYVSVSPSLFPRNANQAI